MKTIKHIFVGILLASTAIGSIQAQDYFAETNARAQAATLHEAIYIWSDYQQFNPLFHAPYFHLGNLYYHKALTDHPIREYSELKESLYRTKLYYGNCLHYAKDQTLKPQYYAGLPYAGKRPEYSELEAFINRRLDTIALISERADNLYTAYYRLVELNDMSRNLFMQFVEKYVGEKMAHLLFTEEDHSLLMRLQTVADSIPEAISNLQFALGAFPLPDYRPEFSSQPIVLYRLDGLTRVSIFQNEVALWDYAEWVRSFLQAQNETYADFYTAIENEYANLLTDIQRLQSGKARKHKPNTVLLNRINRIDYQSFMIDFISLAQQASIIQEIRTDTVFRPTKQITDEYKEQAIAQLLRQYGIMEKMHQLREQLAKRLDETALSHYRSITPAMYINTVDSVKLQADVFVEVAQNGYLQACHAFAENIRPTCVPFKEYVNELSGEKFSAQNLQFTVSDSLITILPVDSNYMVVLERPCVVMADKDGNALTTTEYKCPKPIMAAYKYGSNTIALVCEDRILFVDKTGKEKVNFSE